MDLLDRMQTFARIVETGSLSAAARSLGTSVATVSRQLGALESELRATLVVRSTRRLAVTDSGRRWYEHCARLFQELDNARTEVAEGKEVRGRVVVSAPVTYGVGFLVSRLDRLVRVHPQLAVELRLEDHAIDLVGQGVDIAVRAGVPPPDSAAFIAHRLVSFRRTVVASAAYLRRRGTPKHPADLLQHDLLVQTRASAAFTRWQLSRDDEAVDLPVRPRMSSSSPMVLREWALAGAGITFIPSWQTAGLRPLLTGWRSPPIHVYALHRAELRTAPRIRAVVEAFARDMTDDL